MEIVAKREHLKETLGRSAQGLEFDSAFTNPPSALRGKPFWSWNGDLDKEELIRQVGVAQDMGMGGVFMHSRTGLETEYLGDEWFDLINACAEASEARGIEGWIYDEDRWPSGSAGGLATKDTAYRMRSITLSMFAAGETIVWPPAADFFEAHRVDLDGVNLKSFASLDYESLSTCPEGEQVLVFAREIHPDDAFYNGSAYLDTLSRKATDKFIEITHERYREKCGQHFGKAIKGVFTDEPHRGFILCEGVQQPGTSNSAYSMPYAEDLFEQFEARFGHDLRGRLPELFFQFKGAQLSKLKWEYVELLQQLFIENWAQPCLNWCEENNLLLTGHILHEDSLTAQTVPNGSPARYYEQMSYPGIDVLSQDNRAYWIAKQAVSVARQQGQPYVLSELYGCTGWQMGFDGHKQIGDWQAFLGINLRCPHLSWYSMAGQAKRDYPASIFHQSAWYLEYKHVEDYYARVNLVLQQGDPDCDILVVHPVESVWSQFYLGWSEWLGSASPAVDVIEAKFAQLFRWLTDSQLDFDYGDEEQMGRLAKVELVDGEPLLRLGKMVYRSVVVGGLQTMRASTLELLRSFAKAGGQVVFAGKCPSHLDVIPSSQPADFAQQVVTCDWAQSSIAEALRSTSQQVLRLNEGAAVEGVISHVRQLKNGDLYIALVNTTRDAIPMVKLEVEGLGAVEKLNCRTGNSAAVQVAVGEKGWSMELGFAPLEEHVFYVSASVGKPTETQVEAPLAFVQETTFEGAYNYTLSEPNALLLDSARYQLNGGDWSEYNDVLRVDTEIRERLGWEALSGYMVQPWYRGELAEGANSVSLEFKFTVAELTEAIDLLVERPDRWELSLNGTPIEVPTDPEWFIDIAFKRLHLPASALQIGENTLSMKAVIDPGVYIEAIYLLGDFSVNRTSAGFELGKLPEQLQIGDIVEQGFPYFTGIVTYELPLSDELKGAEAQVEFGSFEGACVGYGFDSESEVIAFPPYQSAFTIEPAADVLEVSVYLTRHNLFGPLHRLPKNLGFTEPTSYRTTGSEYTDEHQFFESGLLAPVVVRIH
jgi:hypothetical protein